MRLARVWKDLVVQERSGYQTMSFFLEGHHPSVETRGSHIDHSVRLANGSVDLHAVDR